MGLSLFKACSTNYSPAAPAPNPDPKRWELIDTHRYKHGYVLVVRYLDCTNFEGIKVMVFRGRPTIRKALDPHFSDDQESPIARFRPDAEGLEMAMALAASLKAG